MGSYSLMCGLRDDQGALATLMEAHLLPFTTKSDFAREHATAVALAASLGWITTILPGSVAYTNSWRVTPRGLAHLARNPCLPNP